MPLKIPHHRTVGWTRGFYSKVEGRYEKFWLLSLDASILAPQYQLTLFFVCWGALPLWPYVPPVVITQSVLYHKGIGMCIYSWKSTFAC